MIKSTYLRALLLFLLVHNSSIIASSRLYRTTVTIEQAKANDPKADPLTLEKEIFLKAFKNAYKNVPTKELNIKNMDVLFNNYFENQLADLRDQTKKVSCFVAKTKIQTAGLIIYEHRDHADEIYVRLLAVDPSLQRQGIGEQLITRVKLAVPTAKKMTLAVRPINIPACNFYKKLGFKKSVYVPGALNPKRYIGLERIF